MLKVSLKPSLSYQTAVFALCCLLGGVFSINTYAVEVEGLYQAVVLVSSKENEDEQQDAFSAAMREVLLKISGSNEVLAPTAIRRALARPQDYVESWARRSIEDELESADLLVDSETSPADTEQIELEVSFYESEILALLEDNNLPLWPSNRQTTLLWIVSQEELGPREVLSSSSIAGNEILTLLRSEAKYRGLPIQLPLMDLEDQQALSADDLWSLDGVNIAAASERYQADSVLALRLYRSLSGELLGKSAYLFRNRAQYQDSFEENLEEFTKNAIAFAAGELSGYYSISLSGISDDISVNLEIEGIDNAKAYAQLLEYVDGLIDVNSYQIVSIDENSLMLELSTGGQIRQLIEVIALGNNLEPITDLNRNSNGVQMYYRWTD